MKLIKNNGLLKKTCLILFCISLIMGINLVYAKDGTQVDISILEKTFYEDYRPIYIITRDEITGEVVETNIYDINGPEEKIFATVRKKEVEYENEIISIFEIDVRDAEMLVVGDHPNKWEVGKDNYKFKAVDAGTNGNIKYEDLVFTFPKIVPGYGSQLFEVEMKRKQPDPGPGPSPGPEEKPDPPGPEEKPDPPGPKPDPPGPENPKPENPGTPKPPESENPTPPEPENPTPENPGTPEQPNTPGGNGPEDSGTTVPGQQPGNTGGNTGNTGGNTGNTGGNTGGNNQIDNNNRGDGIITGDPNIEDPTESSPTDESKLEDAIIEIYSKLQEAIDKAINKIKEDLGKTIDRIKEEMPGISDISKPGFGFDNNKMFSFLLMAIVLLPAIGLALREIFKNRLAILAFFKRKKILLIVGEDILTAEDIAESFLEKVTKIEVEENIFMYRGIYEGKKVSVMNSEDMEAITETDYHELHKKYNVKNIARLERDRAVDSGEFELFDLILINKDWNNGKRKSSEEVEKFIERLTERLNESLADLIDEDIDISEENNLVSIEMEVIDLVTKEKNSDYNIAFLLKIARSLLTEENRQILAEDMIEIVLDLVSEFK